ncbi:MAG TPA: DUF4157 domain-containing protein, partial [Longimicrobium sp.]|nr:DUF4157 domain-containing protein [Longimicrobium sp.]
RAPAARVQRSEGGAAAPVGPALQARIGALRGGEPLPAAERAFMEPRFGHDFSRVRVHTGAEAARTAGALGARAFTLGRDVVFAEGQYRPAAAPARRLLAHELAHVVQQEASGEPGIVQREFALAPPHPEAEASLTPEEVRAAVDAGTALFTDPVALAALRDLLGVPAEPAVVDEAFVRAVATYQARFGLAVSGQVDGPTRRQLARETVAEGRVSETLADSTTSAIGSSLGAFGLEADDFAVGATGRYTGSRVLAPAQMEDIRALLATDRARGVIRENLASLASVDDRFSGVAVDLPYVLTLGARESGERRMLSRSRAMINTAGSDTHPAGASGMDYFHVNAEAFRARGERISPVTSGLLPGREDRRPSLIQNRRLLLAFMVKAAADELAFRGFVRTELARLVADPAEAGATADRLLAGLSIDALRSWKALVFAGVGHGQSAVQHLLRTQHAAGEPFSLEAILTLDAVPGGPDAARLDRARAVALGALAIEGDIP